jgi:hypothetical protein
MESTYLIQKEELAGLRFADEPQITDQAQQQQLQHDLNRALILGNLYRGKVTITFRTSRQEVKRVRTTVWAVTEKYVLLKGNLFLPNKAIVEVTF